MGRGGTKKRAEQSWAHTEPMLKMASAAGASSGHTVDDINPALP